MELNSDGSMKGTTFSEHFNGKKIPYPYIKDGESAGDYRIRVDSLKKEGFHLGDLSWADYFYYCDGY